MLDIESACAVEWLTWLTWLKWCAGHEGFVT